MPSSSTTIAAVALLFLCGACSVGDAIQFFLDTHTRRCFREDIPASMNAVFTYTIAQGSGAMPVRVSVHDVLDNDVSKRDSADHGVITFDTPSSIPDLLQQVSAHRSTLATHRSTWSLSRDDVDSNTNTNTHNHDTLMNDATDKLLSTGDGRIPYLFCFQHDAKRRLFAGHASGGKVQRRIIFDVKYGADARGQQYYDELAKEKHLSSTQELFQVVDDRVNQIVRLIDEMRLRENHRLNVTQTTSRTVSLYSLLACISVTLGAIYTSYWTLQFIAVKTKRRPR